MSRPIHMESSVQKKAAVELSLLDSSRNVHEFRVSLVSSANGPRTRRN
jgi:hypothetical protein